MGATCPLAFLLPGSVARIAGLRAGKGLQSRLFGMGFCPDVSVTVITADRGSIVVSLGDARYALSKGVAMKILVWGIGESA